MLSENEKRQNEKALGLILARFSNSGNFSSASFLDWCSQKDIWLPGLSPTVQEQFIELLDSAFAQKDTPTAQILKTIEINLASALQQENVFLKQQYAQQGSSQSVKQLTIVPDKTEWLEASHVINATQPLASCPQVFVAQPVREVTADVNKMVEATLKSDPDKKLGLVFEDKGGGHWLLHSYEKKSTGAIEKQPVYNPPGDGKCGDHAVVKAYQVAKSHGIVTEVDPLLVKHEKLEQHRDFTRAVITKTTATVPAPTSQKISASEQTVTKVNPVQSTNVQPIQPKATGDYDKLFREWTNKANYLIDELQKCSDTNKAKRWNDFFDKANKQFNPQSSPASITAKSRASLQLKKEKAADPEQVTAAVKCTA